MVTRPPSLTIGHWLWRGFLLWPERGMILLLALAVGAVLWSTQYGGEHAGRWALRTTMKVETPTDLDLLPELVVATRLGPTTYFTQPDGRTVGLEHDLALQFGATLGKPVRFLVLDNLEQVLEAVREGRAHFAAAAVPVNSSLTPEFSFTPPYQKTRPQLIYNAALEPAPAHLADLSGKLVGVVPHPEYLELLRSWRSRVAGLNWKIFPRGDQDLELMQRVFEGALPYALSDSNTVAIAQNYYPDLKVARAVEVGPSEAVAWAFPHQNPGAAPNPLLGAARSFLTRLDHNRDLSRLLEHYYGHVTALEPEDASQFLQKMVTRLPHFTVLFRMAQQNSQIDWRLLAAMAYQESRWDKEAVSPTGVRGIMMLTADTADRLRVSDRTDPTQAIPAAATYLQQLRDLLPPHIGEPDRTWMALAAYNVGLGHLEDARILAQQQHLDPNVWNNLKATLPLLSSPTVYPTTRYGFARGGEPVNFVENIRSYYDILARFEKPYRSTAPSRSSPPM